ncbi:MAG: D-amino-acid transaminase [Nitrospinae bacterium]|nr:D-amino-acid transaminase [Nitrospinota bacterium]
MAQVQQAQSIPVLSQEDVLERLRTSVHNAAIHQYFAMYSSVLGGIVTDPALMILPMDDHMVHRGHAVFDTAAVVNGMLYQLESHLDRFERSARLARLSVPFSRAQMREIILETAAASGQRNASVRYWLSAGPGGFGLAPTECVGSALYVMIYQREKPPDSYYTQGIKILTSTIPIKPPLFARCKSTNYLPNVLVVMEAKDKGADNGIFVDAQGMLGESSNMNVGFVTHDRVLRHPTFDAILTGCTVTRALELARGLVANGQLKDIVVADVPLEEARAAAEMLLIGSSVKVAPITQWDGHPVGDGRPGPVAKALCELLEKDMREGTNQLIPVPYR